VFIALTLIAAVMALQSLVVQEQRIADCRDYDSVGFAGVDDGTADEVAEPIEDQLAARRISSPEHDDRERFGVDLATFSLQSTNPENIANVEKRFSRRNVNCRPASPHRRCESRSERAGYRHLALLSKKYNQAELGTLATTRSCR